MPIWATAGFVYFSYLALVALLLRGLSPGSRWRAIAGAGVGTLLAGWAAWADVFWLRGFVLPLLALLVAYWSSGCLWIAPMEHIERWLARSDRAVGVGRLAVRLPRPLMELLEAAYVGIYPLIPLALALHLWFGGTPDADRFWNVVLVTDFVCFGMLPWIQTRPPRALEADPPSASSVRGFNLGLLEKLSIGVNTVPSGHAAEAVAVALLLSDAPTPIAAAMWVSAAAISAGAVIGRYHYAVDAMAGWLVALVVWLILGRS